MTFRSIWLRIVAVAGVLLCLATPAHAKSGEATDAAFGALLSMPGTQPREGGWVIPEAYAVAPANERELIAHLAKMKWVGADFNAMRHRGTLLAHAIRAGKDQAAIWLLRNGADFRHVRFDSNETAYDLARRYNRQAVIKLLESRHGFIAPKPVVPISSISSASSQPARSIDRVQQAIELMSQLLKTPYPDKAAQGKWQDFAANLSQEEYRAIFKDEERLGNLIRLVRDTEGGPENALSRLPLDLIRRHAQLIADLLAEWSYVNYANDPRISYTAASRGWPALWSQLDQPLNYDKWPDLAGRIPPNLWPALFSSGYSRHEAENTGCLLSAVNLEAFKGLWPDFQLFFNDAREEAPALVLRSYQLSHVRTPCYYSEGPAVIAAKLLFLRAQGVTGPVLGLRQSLLNQASDLAFRNTVTTFMPAMQDAPRLLEVPLACAPSVSEVWFKALIKVRGIGESSLAPEYVQAFDLPGREECGLMISAESWGDYPSEEDDFSDGPFRTGSTRCGDPPDSGELWIEDAGRIRRVNIADDMQGSDFLFRNVRDTQTGKRYLLNNGRRGSICAQSWELPDAYEWLSTPAGPALRRTPDDMLVDRLLRQQCVDADDGEPLRCGGLVSLNANGIGADDKDVLPALRKGTRIPIERLVDVLGADRRHAYFSAVSSFDRKAHRSLVIAGIPARWTAEAIRQIGASDISIPEKRLRTAMVFADATQLDTALNSDRYDTTQSLISWLPREDWSPVLRVIAHSADLWHDAAKHLRESAVRVGKAELACDIDHAQGFLCEGGIEMQ